MRVGLTRFHKPDTGWMRRERQAKEQFAASQGHVTQGFMRMAVAALAVLNRLSSDPNIKQAFLKEPLTARAAFASTTFINTLVGPRVAGLQVREISDSQLNDDIPSGCPLVQRESGRTVLNNTLSVVICWEYVCQI